MSIVETYARRHARSAELAEQARSRFPSGVTHDARFSPPFPLYVERSQGARKWDVDENELIDFVTGHGALLLGHSHPDVVAAVQEQVARGTHVGAEHALALRWAAIVQELFPSIERLRFTASGTEATMLALRLARAATGRPTVVRFFGHYHGWHDLLARDAENDTPAGVPAALRDSTVVLQADLAQVEQTLQTRDDIAAVILEPTGASYGMVPLPERFLPELRRLTEAHGVLLIFDEVVTGFRVAPGGVQQRSGVRADLTTLAKILAGGLPGGAVGGRADVMRHLDFGDEAWNREHKIRHNGTFNANPLAAAAGVAALEHVRAGWPHAHTIPIAERMVAGLNGVLRERRLRGWSAYGDGSIFHLVAGVTPALEPGAAPNELSAADLKRGGDPQVLGLLRMALLNQGIDLMRGRSGFISIAHTAGDIDMAVAAFTAALDDLAAEGALWSGARP
jgi:glutamate-1-semialdehyde 2,1-aminomutase